MEVAGSCLQWQWQNSPSIPRLRLLTYPSLSRRQSLDCLRRTPRTPLARSLSAGFTNDGESDDEFVKRIQHLVLDEEEEEITTTSSASFSAEPPWPAVRPERRDDGLVVPASVKRWADSVGGALPLSLRIIKKKKKRALEGDASTAGESAVKKAFSSTVFIVRELQSYALRMREVLFFENLQGVLARVQEDMNASFVWLFQHIFSSTPTLMVYVMLLLANFTVHSVGAGPALAAAPVPIQHQASALLAVERRDCDRNQDQSTRFESSAVLKTSGIGKTASVSGSGGGGGTKTTKPVAGGTDDGPNYNGGGVGVALPEEEAAVWNRMVEEAARIGAGGRDEALMDRGALRSLVAPVKADAAEPEVGYEEHSRTEMMYHRALAADPQNTLLLSNFAQFLYLVLHDHDRAEYYFKRAVGMKPADAESLSRYASFLWLVRKDLGAAEETYLEAIAAEPSNTHYAANYAHFLWNTGGEGTCYPLDGDDAC
ncbi:uncharacterized protein M6B38_253095 [Iris pallida]|uniref:Uncharacterized protein n=1 Tax=Iris pallida TaxID=29817 RepID=A0AAX6IIF2_IRIPA|nr:uncharacterized protein M6B38_253095 [Iris pallida]